VLRIAADRGEDHAKALPADTSAIVIERFAGCPQNAPEALGRLATVRPDPAPSARSASSAGRPARGLHGDTGAWRARAAYWSRSNRLYNLPVG
jgi:hypothetical protein